MRKWQENKMGRMFAEDLSTMDISLEQSIGYHLQANHYPPVPASMVPVCIEAINAYNDGEYHRELELPEGVLWRNQTEAPAWAIIQSHHLDAWLMEEE
jgi:hypothetical protein